MGRTKVLIPQKSLKYLYLKKYKSAAYISRLYNCTAMTVRARLKEFGIPLHSFAASRMHYKKYDFSGDLIEKAYLIGFRLGDLNVYQKSKISESIVARCNTTQIVQIRLIKKLFSKYGRVTISHGVYSTNVNCYLNMSFKFLLSNIKDVPVWIKQDKKVGMAFIAGYTDAEGNFLLNQAKARFKIDSYDKEIILWIASFLEKRGIRTKAWCIARSGALRRGGYKLNNDLWRININEAFSLLRFIQYIKIFTKHKTRLKHMIICEKNIMERIKRKSIKYVTN